MTHIIIIYNFSLIEWMQNDKIVQKSVSQSSNCKAIPITLYICVRVEFKFRLGDGKFDCYHFWLLCDFRWCLLYRNRAVYFQKNCEYIALRIGIVFRIAFVACVSHSLSFSLSVCLNPSITLYCCILFSCFICSLRKYFHIN